MSEQTGLATSPARTPAWSAPDLRAARGLTPRPSARASAPPPSLAVPEDAAAKAARLEQRVAELEGALGHRVAEARAAGVAEGRAQGEAAAAQTARAALDPAAQAMAGAVAALQRDAGRWLAHLEENIAALAVAVARQLVGDAVTQDPTVVGRLATRVLGQVPLDGTIRLRVSPSDAPVVESAVASWLAERRLNCSIVADPKVAPGGVLLETPSHVVDGRPEAGLARLYQVLVEGARG